MTATRLLIEAIPGLPEVVPGADLASLVNDATRAAGLGLASGDVVVVAQKIVSKAQGRVVDLAAVTPSSRAEALAVKVDKDPRLVEVILSESRDVLAAAPGVLVVEHRSGHVMANAGVDRSNVGSAAPGRELVLLLPEDSDSSAEDLRAALERLAGVPLGVIVSDSVGRPWRNGTAAIALGAAGLPALLDLRGRPDRDGRALAVSTVGVADQIAAAAALVTGEGAEGRPVAIVRGLELDGPAAPASALLRPSAQDLFR
jgi:coenzyme F420-0:L-glutamate ligase/coenzyme F420-1:gamma-L-glutamate ligase